MLIRDLLRRAPEFKAELLAAKEAQLPAPGWYPYDSISNLWHLDRLLPRRDGDLTALLAGPVADIGAADGDLAHFLARQGYTVDVIDHAPTNYNGLEGARLLGVLLGTDVAVHDIDLDTQFTMPRENYSLVLFLGILYHLKNPFYALERLTRHSEHVFLSTRVARQTADGRVRLHEAPVAYLVDPYETNSDPTNYWIFSIAGLRRLVQRTGWAIVHEMTVGRTKGDSNPSDDARDERAFMLLKRARS